MAGLNYDYPPTAGFYPNLASYIPTEIYGLRVNATHDLNAKCFENRSFLDFALWKYLKEGNSQLEEVVGPHPPCKKIELTKVDGGNIVVGMLKNIVGVTLLNVTKDSKGKIVADGEGTPLILFLENVLLVENLPVPMHIGTKANSTIFSAVSHSEELMIKGKQTRFKLDVIMKLAKQNFPERYRKHPYWTRDVVIRPPGQMKEYIAGLAMCMEEGDGKDARNELAKKYGWQPISHPSPVLTESWEHEETGRRIDYYPMTDRMVTTYKSSDTGKSLARACGNVGGNINLEVLFRPVAAVRQASNIQHLASGNECLYGMQRAKKS